MKIAHAPLEDFVLIHAIDALSGVTDAVAVFAMTVARVTGKVPAVGTDAVAPREQEIVIGDTNRDTAAVRSARAAILADGFAILADGSRLYITATTGRGLVYGIYAFLENHLGMRFYSSRYRVFHPERVLDVPADLCRVDNPGFMSRDVFWYDVLHPAVPADAGECFDFPCACRSNHGDMLHVGGGVSYAGDFVHTLPALAETSHEVGAQPCLCDETVFKTVRRNVRRWLSEHPSAKIVSVSQNDSWPDQGGCTCPACRAIDEQEGTPMGSLLTFVNRIADDIREDFPDVWVDTLAYRYTRKAPKTVVPARNVIIRLCSIECCFSHPLDDPDCPQNVAFKQDVEAWSAICDHLYVWDYTTDFLYYLSPFPNLAVLRDNVRFFKDHHVIGVFEQGNYQALSGEFGELRAYLLSKLLWDPAMSAEQYDSLMNEFLADYYGAGWRSVRAYIDETTRLGADRHLGIYDRPDAILPATPELSFRLLTLWNDAIATATTEDHRAHVAQSRIQALCHATFVPDDSNTLLPELYDALNAAGVTHFRESTPIPAPRAGEPLFDLH